MATYKRIDGDYNITTLSSDDNVTITTHTVIINGNLDVQGNVTYIETTDLIVDDPFILLAANNTGSGSGALFPDAMRSPPGRAMPAVHPSVDQAWPSSEPSAVLAAGRCFRNKVLLRRQAMLPLLV